MGTIVIGGITVYRVIATGKIIVHKNSVQSIELTEEQEQKLKELLEKFINQEE